MAVKPVDPPSSLLLCCSAIGSQGASLLGAHPPHMVPTHCSFCLNGKTIRVTKTKRTAEHPSLMITTSQDLPGGCCSCNPCPPPDSRAFPMSPAVPGPRAEYHNEQKGSCFGDRANSCGGIWSREPDGKEASCPFRSFQGQETLGLTER